MTPQSTGDVMERYLETDRGMKEYIHGNWVRHDDAQSRIAELEAEVARLTLFNKECRKTLNDLAAERDAAWDDALEAAATVKTDQGYDLVSNVTASAIRALKRG